jgi:hypothetical protein
MTAIIKKTLGYVIADTIINDIRSNRAKYYYFIGKSVPFENNPETFQPNFPLLDSAINEQDARAEMALLRKIPASDVSMVIPRKDWAPNTVFSMYDATSDVKDYYCVNSQHNVYKCLDNNNNGLSTIEPISITQDSFVLADGYVWKFLYAIPLALKNKFMTSEHIPVIRSLNTRFFSNGSIPSVNIISSGSGYTQATTTVVVNGNGQGAKMTPVIEGGQLVDLIIDNPGVGYTFANIEIESTRTNVTSAVVTVDLSQGDVNSPQSLVELLTNAGTIDSITVTQSGIGYTTAFVAISGDGIGASATATVGDGVIQKINIIDPGYNYTRATVTISGNGIGAVAIANISPPFGHGRNAPEELHSDSLMLYQNFIQQKVGDVVVENDFSQYGIIRNPLNLSYGTNIESQVNKLSYSVICDFGVDSDVTHFPINSQVYIVKNAVQKVFRIVSVISGITGSGVILEGDGTEVEVNDVVISANDPTKTFQVALSESRAYLSANNISCSYYVSTTGDITQFETDMIVTSAQKEFRILSLDRVNKNLLLLSISNGILSTGSVINIKGTAISFTATTVIPPDIDKRTGEILFIENRLPYNQTDDQSITFRTVLKF